MAITINSNLASLRIQRNLSTNGKGLEDAYAQLSSGQRINKASDDSAGLAIADSLKAKSRVLTQGVRNLNDGISLLSIADSALGSLVDITSRLKELAEQSANGVYGTVQRSAIDKEAQALSKEFTRIAKTTSFNGLNVFDGSVQGVRLQAGQGEAESIFSTLGGQKASGTFSGALSSAGIGGSTATAGDFNGDGIADIAVSTFSSPSVIAIGLGRGDGTFAFSTTLLAGAYVNAITSVDVNNDGILDTVTTNTGDSTVSVFIGKGDGTFASQVSSKAGTGAFRIATGDLNGDGILDIVTGDYSSNSVAVLLGNGNGTYKTPFSYATGFGIKDVKVADLNGDGILDILSADSAGSISIFSGKGDGTFGSRTIPPSAGSCYGIDTGDFNGDGIIDIVTADDTNATVSVFLGSGNGNFNSRITLSNQSAAARTIIAADLNGDGFTDIISTDSLTSTSAFFGRGDGTFSAKTTLMSSTSATKLVDLNNDGILDLLNLGGITALGIRQDGVGAINAFTLKTRSGALDAINTFDTKFKVLTNQIGTIGAFQSRVSVAISTILGVNENIKAAESRIRDADIATVAADLSRRNVVQQTSVALLAQANQQPAIALKLLQ